LSLLSIYVVLRTHTPLRLFTIVDMLSHCFPTSYTIPQRIELLYISLGSLHPIHHS